MAPIFLHVLADEAKEAVALLVDLERGWSAVAGHRRHARTPAAVDLMAALPLLSATSLAQALGILIKSACAILDALVPDGVVVRLPAAPDPGRGKSGAVNGADCTP